MFRRVKDVFIFFHSSEEQTHQIQDNSPPMQTGVEITSSLTNSFVCMCHPSHSLRNLGMRAYEVLGEGFEFFFLVTRNCRLRSRGDSAYLFVSRDFYLIDCGSIVCFNQVSRLFQKVQDERCCGFVEFEFF